MGRAARGADELFYGDELAELPKEALANPSHDWQVAEEVFAALYQVRRHSVTFEKLPDPLHGLTIISPWNSLELWDCVQEPAEWERRSANLSLGVTQTGGQPIFIAAVYEEDEDDEPFQKEILYQGQSLEEAERAILDNVHGVDKHIAKTARRVLKETLQKVNEADLRSP